MVPSTCKSPWLQVLPLSAFCDSGGVLDRAVYILSVLWRKAVWIGNWGFLDYK